MASGNYLVIRMSVESFKESISISNKFYFGLGIALIIITTMIIIEVTRRYTKPVLQLADISKRMSNLDFEAKYTGHHNDEIGILGESMNEMSEKLETTISELKSANIELHKDIAKKEEIDEMRKEFISNVSHELKTPIALIQGYAEGLQEGINDNPEDMQYYCDVIIDEANKMNKMVKNLLTLNQLEFGNNQISLERFDIVSVVSGVIHSMQLHAEQRQVNIVFTNQKPIYVWADEFQIEEVITNYLSNAFNHVDENKLIKVEITEKNGIVRVSVFNTGKQIPEEELENIWIKFHKVDKARTRAYGGNGIGLSIVKAIMERHGKACGVLNHNNGVEFWFELDV
jgi:signal transduction histidine kinase